MHTFGLVVQATGIAQIYRQASRIVVESSPHGRACRMAVHTIAHLHHRIVVDRWNHLSIFKQETLPSYTLLECFCKQQI